MHFLVFGVLLLWGVGKATGLDLPDENFRSLEFEGTWLGKGDSQADFFVSKSGLFHSGFVEKEGPINLEFMIFEKSYVDSKLMTLNVTFAFVKDGTYEANLEANLTSFNSLISENSRRVCRIASRVNIDEKSRRLSGTIASPDCKIELDFSASESQPMDWFGSFVASSLVVAAMALGAWPAWQALRDDNYYSILPIGETVFLLNISIDVANMNVQTSIMTSLANMRNVFFMPVFFAGIMAAALKIRAMMSIIEHRLISNRAKTIFFIKSGIHFVLAALLSIFLIFYREIYYYLFLYLLFMIWRNMFSNTRNNAFSPKVHLPLFLSQIFLPIVLRLPFVRFRFQPDLGFCLVLSAIVVSQVTLMFLQKVLGPAFFLPKTCRPGFFEYSEALEGQAGEQACPVCFVPLSEDPDKDHSNLEQRLVLKNCYRTPCGHRFHKSCLVEWMDCKLECPCCRKGLPVA